MQQSEAAKAPEMSAAMSTVSHCLPTLPHPASGPLSETCKKYYSIQVECYSFVQTMMDKGM